MRNPVDGTLRGGRPPPPVVKLDPANETQVELIRSLAMIHCTQAEAAAVLKVSREHFNVYLNGNERIRAVWEAGLDEGKASLRRAQFKSALGSDGVPGNVTAQIWLGKQILGQTDNMALMGPKGGPLETKHSGLDELVRALDQLAAGRAGDAVGPVGVAADRKADAATTH